MSKVYQNQPLKLLVKGINEEGETLTSIGATVTNLIVVKEGEDPVTWVGAINADDERFIEYDCVKDVDLDVIGLYKIMSDVDNNLGDGPWPGNTVTLKVWERFT